MIFPELGVNKEIRIESRVSGLDPEKDISNNRASRTLEIAQGSQPGSLVWKLETDHGHSFRPYTFSLGSNTMFIPSGSVLHAYNKQTREQIWRFDSGEYIGGLTDPHMGHVYIATDKGKIIAIDESIGTAAWRHDLSGSLWSALTVSRGTVYAGLRSGKVIALDAIKRINQVGDQC